MKAILLTLFALAAALPQAIAQETDPTRATVNVGEGRLESLLTDAPSDTAKDFTATQHVKDVHVLFQPQVRIGKDGRRSRTFLDGCKVAELPKNAVEDETDETAGGE